MTDTPYTFLGTGLNCLLAFKTIWGTIYSPHSVSPLRQGRQIDSISLTDGNGCLDVLMTWILQPSPGTEERSAARSESHLERRRAQMCPTPSWKECHTHPCYRSVAMLPLECSALSHCSLHTGWPGRPRPFPSNYLCCQEAESRFYLEPWKHGIHSAQWERLLKENKHFLDRLLEICLSPHDFNWYLRH